jgi:SAM-dependent methyltransferase/uncharacterized protein YbaR (Trm112 family)
MRRSDAGTLGARMRPEWLTELVDPDTRQPLVLTNVRERTDREIIDAELSSVSGDHVYPVLTGVPRFVPRAFYHRSQGQESGSLQTVQCYGDYWRAKGLGSGETQVELQTYEDLLRSVLRIETLDDLRRVFGDGMNILDAGCGVGWAESRFNFNPNARRFAVDMSSSAEIAFDATRSAGNVLVAQADILRLPFRESYFDVIFSFGVLHHTGDARGGFARLCSHLKPHGLIGISVYKVKPFVRELADERIRSITTVMDAGEFQRFVEQVTRLGKALQGNRQPLTVEEDVPLLGIKRGEYSVHKFVYDHFLKCYYNERLGMGGSVSANVDWYRPRQASHHTREEVSAWFEENGIEDVRFEDIPGWEHASFLVSGRKRGSR